MSTVCNPQGAGLPAVMALGMGSAPEPSLQQQPQLSWGQRNPVVAGLLASGASVSPAAAVTTPFDVVKVRQQMMVLSTSAECSTSYGMLNTARQIVSKEGYNVLLRGMTPAALGGMCYGGVRLGLYQPLKDTALVTGLSSNQLVQQVAAGSASGALAAAAFNPLELLKTKMQAKNKEYCIKNTAHIAQKVLRQDGLLGLWAGVGPSMARASVLNASQCATYDVAKRRIMRATGWDDGFAAQLATSLLTGVVTTTATAPVDMVKSRIFVGGRASGSSLAVAAEVLRQEGFLAFFQGWTAQYLRLGPQTMLTFLLLERTRQLVGLSSL